MRELAGVRVRAGYKHLWMLRRHEGSRINPKRVYRLYTEEGLTLRRRQPKRHRSAVARVRPTAALGPNEQCAMDFMQGTVADSRLVRILTVLDVPSPDCVVVAAAPAFRGHEVAEVLSQVEASEGLPARIRVDIGTEFTSKALDHWAYRHRVELDFSRPGMPVDNTFIHRSLQWHPPARVPIATLISQSRGHAANPSRVARGLQQPSPAQQLSGRAAGSIPSGRLLRPTPQPAPKRAWPVDQDLGELRFRTVDIWNAA